VLEGERTFDVRELESCSSSCLGSLRSLFLLAFGGVTAGLRSHVDAERLVASVSGRGVEDWLPVVFLRDAEDHELVYAVKLVFVVIEVVIVKIIITFTKVGFPLGCFVLEAISQVGIEFFLGVDVILDECYNMKCVRNEGFQVLEDLKHFLERSPMVCLFGVVGSDTEAESIEVLFWDDLAEDDFEEVRSVIVGDCKNPMFLVIEFLLKKAFYKPDRFLDSSLRRFYLYYGHISFD